METSMMRLGLQIPSFTYPGVPDDRLFDKVADIATTAEQSGFDSVWVMDHFYQIPFVGQRTEPMLEAYTVLSALAARTSSAHLGTMVTGVTYRNPAHLAKIVTTLDVVSSGRAILGIGAAWNEDEHRGYGWDFLPVRERMDRLEEALQICRAMFTQEAPTFQGQYYRTEAVLNFPRPIRPTGIPILVGGSGERRTLRLVAKYADACNLFGDLETIRHKVDVVRRHCDELGRDPSEIRTTRLGAIVISPTEDEAAKKAEAGAARRGMTLDQYRAYAVMGTPDQVSEQAQAFLDAGLTGLIFNMPDVYDLETVALAGKTLSSVVGG
jgi:F420-dependent oxidoreductase-like protein